MPDQFIDQSEYDRAAFQVDYGQLVDNQESIIQEITRGANI